LGRVRAATGWTPHTMTRPTLIALTEPEGLNVLVADDNPASLRGLELAVRSLGHSCAVACDGLEAWDMHQANRADVILADWNMPGLSGIELCRRVRLEAHGAYTHFIFVTGKTEKVHFIEGMHAGADDYITKPVDLDELEARLEVSRRAVLIRRLGDANSSALRRKSDHNSRIARIDPLTGVSNRLELKEDLEALASRVRLRPYSAAICDIDRFKAYNDCFGHLAGDDVLRRVAQTIHAGLRQSDGFYRYGGEEFLAILPEQSLAEAAAGIDRVRHEVEELRVIHAPEASMPFVTISAGIAELRADSTGTIEDWLSRADTSLYRAKTLGRNRIVMDGDGGVEERAARRAWSQSRVG
jgi:two-component system cell cycle response regulator